MTTAVGSSRARIGHDFCRAPDHCTAAFFLLSVELGRLFRVFLFILNGQRFIELFFEINQMKK
jgi:hypothetical protein